MTGAMDYANEATQIRRVPQDDFERELYRRFIQAETSRWYDTETAKGVKVYIGEVPDRNGAYDLHIFEPYEDWMRVAELKGEARGKVWLCERESPASEYYRVAVWHEVDGFANTGAAPTLQWR